MPERPPTGDGSPVRDLQILWIRAGLRCDGDTVSVTAARLPSLEDVPLGAIPGLPRVRLHNPVPAYEVGGDFLKHFHDGEPFVPCSCGFKLAATRSCDGGGDGDIPLSFRCSGAVFHADEGGVPACREALERLLDAEGARSEA